MTLADDLMALDERIEARCNELVRLQAELAGLRAQRHALGQALKEASERASAGTGPDAPYVPDVPDLRRFDRTEAIEHVLRSARRLMSISDVLDALRAGGRPEPDRQVVASTLNFLHRRGRISKPRRGFYAS